MIIENLSTLKINKLTRAQYERELEAGRIDENSLYLIPDEDIDLSLYDVIRDELSNKASATHTHDDCYYTEIEIDTKFETKSDVGHSHKGEYDVSGSAATALSSANAYTDSKIDLLNSAITNKANAADLNTHVNDDNVHFTIAERTKLSGIDSNANNYTHPSYTARTGVPTANATLTHGGTFTVSQPVCDANGHITALNTRTYTLPSDNNTDTKVTNTLATTTKAYVTGTTSATTNTGTQVFDTGVYLDTAAGKLTADTFNGETFSGSGVATVSEVKTYLGI